jgi:SAM-dependent methyltransferase
MFTWDKLAKEREIRIDLGSGIYPRPGFVGIDDFRGSIVQLLGAGRSQTELDEAVKTAPLIEWDLLKGIPLPNHCVAEVSTSHFLEHFSNLDFIFEEIYRVLVPGGRFTIVVPYAQSVEGLYPGHSIFFTEKWFELNPLFQKLFAIQSRKYDYTDYYKDLPAYSRMLLRVLLPGEARRRLLFNVVNQMTLICVPRKQTEPQATPVSPPGDCVPLKLGSVNLERLRASRTGRILCRILPAGLKQSLKRRLSI